MRCPRLLILFALLALTLPGSGAGNNLFADSKPKLLDLDLPGAVRLALEKSFSIDAGLYLPDIARERLRSAWGQFDPELTATYLRSESTDRTVFNAQDPDSPLSSIDQRDEFNVGIRGLLPWGGVYNAGVASTNDRGTFNQFQDNFSTTPQVSVTQPLLRGFGFGANMAQVRIARTNAAISEWQVRQTVIEAVTTVVVIYNELYFAIENVEVARRSRDLAGQLVKDNTRRAEIGVMSPLDITTARAEAAAREEAVIVAERAVSDNENFLKRLVTNDIESFLGIRVTIRPPPIPLAFAPQVEEGVAQAFDLRPDYRQALLDLERRKITIAFTRNDALPQMDLTGSLRLLGMDNDVGTSFDRSIRRDRTEWTAGAVISLPIPNRQRLGNLKATVLEQAQALVNLKLLEQNIVLEVDNAAGQIVTTKQRIASTREARRLAVESLDAGEQRLRAGTGTTFEVLQLQKDLAEVEVSELRARADYHRAVAQYENRTGTTLERWNISIGR